MTTLLAINTSRVAPDAVAAIDGEAHPYVPHGGAKLEAALRRHGDLNDERIIDSSHTHANKTVVSA